MFGAPSIQPREDRRVVILPVRFRIGATWSSAQIRNISSRGICVQIDPPPRRGSYVELYRQHHVIVGQVMWAEGGRCGVRTQDRLDIRAVIEAKPTAPRPAGERRAVSRDIGAHTAASTLVARRVQQGALLIVTLAAAAMGAATAGETLRSPLEAITARL